MVTAEQGITLAVDVGPIRFNILLDSPFFRENSEYHVERHKHATYEFHYITSGSGVLHTDDGQYPITCGSFYIIRDGVHHMQVGTEGVPLCRHSFRFYYDVGMETCPAHAEADIRNFIGMLGNMRLFHSTTSTLVGQTIGQIQTELQSDRPGRYTKVRHLFAVLLVECLQVMAAESECLWNSSHTTPLTDDRIRIIDSFFDSIHGRKITIADLCALAHVSKSQLNRIFREKYQMSFKQKYMETQIEHSKDMLQYTDTPIKAIAEAMGYGCVSNFSAFFKQKTGCSPNEFRKRSRRIHPQVDKPAE